MARRGKGGRFTKGGRRKSTLRRSAPAPKIRRTRSRVRYYSKPSRRPRIKYRRGISTRTRTARTARVVAAAVAAAGIGAVMGSIANEAGLLQKAPTQNMLGISATGLVGGALVIMGMFVKSEGLKLLFYGLGGGLLVEEITRQIDMRFYDFRVAFYGAPALDYSQGISGAQLQLAQQSAQGGFGAPSTPTPQLSATSTPSAPAQPRATPTPANQPSVRRTLNPSQAQAINSLNVGEVDLWRTLLLQAPQGDEASALEEIFVMKGMLQRGQGLPLEPQTIQMLATVTPRDLERLRLVIQAGGSPVNGLEVILRDKALLGPVESLGDLYSLIRE